jgi:hypothetical protein
VVDDGEGELQPVPRERVSHGESVVMLAQRARSDIN